MRTTRRSRTTRRLLVTAGAVAICATLAGCFGSSGGTASKGPVTLVAWDRFSPEENAAYQQLIKEFKSSHRGIVVKQVHYSWDDYWKKLQAAIAIRRGPDVGLMYAAGFLEPYKRGLLPLDGLITADERKRLMFIDQSRSPSDGKAYILPWGVDGAWIFYNKALFKKASVDPNKALGSFSGLLGACDALKRAGVSPFANGVRSGSYFGYELLSQIGGQLLSPGDIRAFWQEKLPWDSPGVKLSLNYLMQFFQHCLGPNAGSTADTDASPDFLGHKAAMLWDIQMTNVTKEQKELGAGNVGIGLFPRLPGSKYPQYMDAQPWDGWAITRWSTHVKEAREYIAFMTSAHAQNLFWQKAHIPPNDRTVTVTTDKPLWREGLRDAHLSANHLGVVPSSQDEIDMANRLYGALAFRRMSIDQFTRQLDALRKQAGR